MNAAHAPMRASDLFVMLERAFRRRSKNCHACTFSLPFSTGLFGGWTVNTSEACSAKCRMILEELVSEFQQAYRLSDTGSFYAFKG